MKVTLKTIAEEAGVSPMVVSAVARNDFSRIRVSEVRKKEIRELIRKYNYVPNATARSLVNRQTHLINLFVPSMHFFEVPFQQQMMAGLERDLSAAGYRLSFSSFRTEDVSDECPVNVMADAGLFFYYGSGNDTALRRISGMPFPLLVFGRGPEGEMPVVYRDSRSGMYELTRTVIENGHKDILLISAFRGDIHNQDGIEGVCKAVGDFGIESFDEVQLPSPLRAPAPRTGLLHGLGFEVAREVLKRKMMPSALIFTEDTIALAAMKEFQAHGVTVPEQISIVASGCDLYSDFVSPRLTKLTIDPHGAGKRCAEKLLSLIDKTTDSPFHEALPMTVYPGESLASVS